jgi:hypothetical protein
MPKEIKGNPRRKPPEPSSDHLVIEAWFGLIMPSLRPIVEELDNSIRTAVSGLHYAVKFHRAFYGLPEQGWIIELATYHVSVNILFLGGADFDAPPPLGTVGRTRYVKITSLDDARRPELRKLIEHAGRTPGWT